MKKCFSCGFDNADDSNYCAACGAALSADPFEPKNESVAPSTAQTASVGDGAEQAPPQTGESAQQSGGFKAKVGAAKRKTLEFEKKHSIIVNAVVAVCAIVIALVALFAPIRTVMYVAVFNGGNMNIEDVDESKGSVTYSYVEIDQSIWQMIGAISYIKADASDLKNMQAEVSKAQTAVSVEVMAWMAAHPNADELEAAEALAEICSDHLSDINYLGYIMATKGDTTIDGEDVGVSLSGDYWAAVLSMAFGLIITVLAIVTAVISLVYLIFAVIGMVKKKPQQKLFKYLGTMLGISGAGLSLMFAAPMFKAGGGMLGIALFTAIMYLICGAAGALLSGKDRMLAVLKRSIIALVAIIAFSVLTTNIFNVSMYEGSGKYEAVNAPTGYGIYGMLAIMDMMANMGDKVTTVMALRDASGITGVIFYLLMAGFAVSYAYKAMKRSLKRLAFGDVAKSRSTSYMIASAVFMLISIITAMALSDMIIEKLFGVFSDGAELGQIGMEWTMRAQVWVSMILLIIAAVFDIAFKVADKQPVPVENVEQPAEQTVVGA